jgi:AcrR family transcriptional regulator
MPSQTTRDAIIATADRLFYESGFEHASFADIAAQAGVGKGNFYYYFKTKESLLEAVTQARAESVAAMLAQWSAQSADPLERIETFVRLMARNQSKIMKHGCPIGSLCMELARLDHPLKPKADALMRLFHDWLTAQFSALGPGIDAPAEAMRALARAQGVAVMAQSLGDADFIAREIEDIVAAARRLAAAAGSQENACSS